MIPFFSKDCGGQGGEVVENVARPLTSSEEENQTSFLSFLFFSSLSILSDKMLTLLRLNIGSQRINNSIESLPKLRRHSRTLCKDKTPHSESCFPLLIESFKLQTSETTLSELALFRCCQTWRPQSSRVIDETILQLASHHSRLLSVPHASRECSDIS